MHSTPHLVSDTFPPSQVGPGGGGYHIYIYVYLDPLRVSNFSPRVCFFVGFLGLKDHTLGGFRYIEYAIIYPTSWEVQLG